MTGESRLKRMKCFVPSPLEEETRCYFTATLTIDLGFCLCIVLNGYDSSREVFMAYSFQKLP